MFEGLNGYLTYDEAVATSLSVMKTGEDKNQTNPFIIFDSRDTKVTKLASMPRQITGPQLLETVPSHESANECISTPRD